MSKRNAQRPKKIKKKNQIKWNQFRKTSFVKFKSSDCEMKTEGAYKKNQQNKKPTKTHLINK